MKKSLIILLISVSINTAYAQRESTETKPVQIAWITPISINKFSDSITYNASINILAGYNHAIKGAEIGSLINVTRSDAKYVQLSGLINWVGQKSTGVQAAGIFNRSENLQGAQISGLINSSQTTNGLQLAGFANQTSDLKGVQVSGMINYAKNVNGFQLGFINIADSIQHGASFGFISIVKSGIHQFELSSNDVAAINLSFRSGSNTLYGIFTSGIQATAEPLWTAGLGFGTRFNIKKDKVFGAIEATGSSINKTEGNLEQDLNILNRLSLNVGYKMNRFLINAGPVLNIYVTRAFNKEIGTYGFNIDNSNFFDKTSHGTNTRMWVGYHVGIWF